MKITPLNGRFVADVEGVDLAQVTDEDFAAIHRAWIDHGVLRFREQTLDEDGLQRFSERFGPLEEAPFGRMPEAMRRRIRNRFVTVISNIVENGRPIGGLGSGEANWHSDMTYFEDPPPASVLLGVEIPDSGGDTWFADQYAALDALPSELEARIEGLSIKHDAAHTSVGQLRPGFDAFDDPREAPGAVHPIVQTHPESGRRCLYLGRREWACVVGLPLEESEALLDELWQYAALEANVWRHQWRVGDVIIWDNRCVLHRRDAIDPEKRRLLRRCQVLAPA
ncbi:MAG: TauD/TfdA family dioxygenase [Pseudomonadales bacterium]|jgi:taurine dioxygenase|nr:TauD/TfdA family dioxygenase [Pseudomonadales bacterium]